MSIEIKEGHYYRDRLGQVHGPMLRHSMPVCPWTTRDRRRYWKPSGIIYGCHGDNGQLNLVEEVRIVPVNDEGGDT